MKKVLLTGASGGIGIATARKFLQEGYFVIAQYNENLKPLEELMEESKEFRDYLFPVKADLSCDDGVYVLSNAVKNSFKGVDAIVLNAGVGLYELLTDTRDQDIDKILKINLSSPIKIARELLPYMISKKQGKIAIVSSIWGISGACMETVYSATKAGLIGFTKALAKEVGDSGIVVNCVCPGVIDTPMNARFSEQEKLDLINGTPLKRLGKPQDIAELIYFLTSEKASFITGQVVTSDGGFIL